MSFLRVLTFDLMDYGEALRLQEELHQKRVGVESENTLLLLEHPPVLTLGSSGKMENILLPMKQLEQAGIAVYKIGRGGDITYHGPGQLVGYPIIDLKERGRDISRYIRELEEVIIQVLKEYGLIGERIDGLRGVWVNQEKICAVGVQVRRWVTMHGFAFNVNTELSHFNYIIPCGIRDK
ncbi:MAG: lipoyl(octanoyl) transferase LipB, partial [Candidatus Tectomicrobia bacterium]|nr:lipoyl(octanoyl) transferase LipB [Candidatus Tectomicrobia bacterium]